MSLMKHLRKKSPDVRRPRPHLETLERRDVPTVVFNPHFGAETVQGADVGMQNPNVNFVFSGSYWNTAQGKSDESAMLASAKNILGPTYLDGLKQYGSDGKATFDRSWNDAATVASRPTADALQAFLQRSIKGHGSRPGDYDLRHAPIYVVVSDPTSSAGANGGWNAGGTYNQAYGVKGFTNPENIHMIWIGTSTGASGINRDIFTSALSHEIVETISQPSEDGITVTAPAGLPADLGGATQIGDNEPAAPGQSSHYGYRLNGDLVQPYWSRVDNAYIVPDGNRQKFFLDPIWDGSTFSGTYNLTVQGDQLVNRNDFVRVDTTPIASGNSVDTSVTLNNETARFDYDKINQINVNTGGGSNGVRINSLVPNTTVNVNGGIGSNDLVFVGSESESLSAIKGAVNVSNASGHTHLIVDGQADPAADVTITDHSVGFYQGPTIGYTGEYPQLNGGAAYGVNQLDIYDGKGGQAIRVDSKPRLTSVAIHGSYSDWLFGDASLMVALSREHA